MTTSAQPGHDRFVHPALFYRGEQEYLQGLVPFIAEGLARGDPVAAAVPGANLALLRQALGADAARVRLLDMADAGRNPGRIIAGVLRWFADRHPGRHVRIIGEPIWPGRASEEYPACAQHEALINAAFTGRDVTIVCPYDAIRLQAHVLADAQATHPLLWQAGRHGPSRRYAPGAVVERYNLPLNGDHQAAVYTATTAADLPKVRRFTVEHARRYGLARERIGDLELIVTELVTNSLVHAGSAALVRIWSQEDLVACQVSDTGRLTDPLAGRRPAAAGRAHGRGLLLVNELADLVRMHTSDSGTTVRVYVRRHPR